MDERVDVIDGRELRSLVAAPARLTAPDVVIVPGLGALGYLTRLAGALAALGARCTLLDLPGFGSRRALAAAPTVTGVAETTVRWLDRRPAGRPVILVGYSTGAQAAARAARRTTCEL